LRSGRPGRLAPRDCGVLRRQAAAGTAPFMRRKDAVMLILGIICLILGFILSIPVLWTIGIILAVIGVILWIVGATNRTVLGRRYWY
jgi:type IV secretory pathway TrbD component